MIGVASVATVVVLVAATVLSPPPVALAIRDLDVVASPPQGTDHLLLTRAGGQAVDLGNLAVLVAVDGHAWADVSAGPAGALWALGETIDVPLPGVLANDAGVTVTLVDRTQVGSAQVVAELDIRPPSAHAAGSGPLLLALPGDADGVIEARPTESFLANAQVTHSQGRKLVLEVRGEMPGLVPPKVMRDDGTGGDGVAADGSYHAYFTIPVDALPGRYPLLMTATDVHGATSTCLTWVDVLPRDAVGGPSPDGGASPEGGPDGAGGPEPSSTPEAGPTGSAPTASGDGASTEASSPEAGADATAPAPAPTTSSTTPAAAAPPPPLPAFSILPGGGISTLCTSRVDLRVVGTQITYGPGGPPIPVRMDFTKDQGKTLAPLFGGNPVSEGRNVTFASIPSGSVLGIRGRADYSTFHASYVSYVADPHVAVLKDGDVPPAVGGFAGQKPLADFLKPFVKDGKIALASHQAIILYEFNPNLQSTAADYQDLVVLFDFPAGGCPEVITAGSGAILTTGETNLACKDLPGGAFWKELKVEPVKNGTYTNGVVRVTISAFDKKRFDWTSDKGLDAVFVKGGSAGSHLYRYDPASLGARGLTTPGSTTQNDISHISFCYEP